MAHRLSATLFDSSLLRLRAAGVTALAMLLTFANVSLVYAQVPTQQPAVDKKVLALAEALKDLNGRAIYSAAEVLRDIGPDAKAAVPDLAKALEYPTEQFGAEAVRWVAAAALCAIKADAKTAVPALEKALNDPYAKVKWMAIDALRAYGYDWKATVSALVEALTASGTVSTRVEALKVSGVAEASEKDKWNAAVELRAIGPDAKAAVPALEVALKDPNPDVQIAAAAALGAIGPGAESAVPALVEALNDLDPTIRLSAAVALGAIGPDAKAAAPALMESLGDSNAAVIRAAEKALDAIGGLEASTSETHCHNIVI